MATPISRDTLNKETNARFWAQVGLRPGYKIDPNNPTDKAYIPVWNDIFKKVKAEADAGTLVTTYDQPTVVQNLQDAQVANTVAAAHVEAAAKATDPWDVQTNTAAATTATQVASQKLSEAAAQQPPTVSPELAEKAAREAAKSPPPPGAPAAEHIAHAQTQVPKPPRPAVPPRDVLYRETNQRFWQRTGYKTGKKLDMSDPTDREMAKVWMDIFREVQREANEGRLTLTPPEAVARPPILTAPPPQARPPAPIPQRPPAPIPQLPVPQPPARPPVVPWPLPGLPMPGMRPGVPGMPVRPGTPPGMPMPMPTPTRPGMPTPGAMPPGMPMPGAPGAPGAMSPGMPMPGAAMPPAPVEMPPPSVSPEAALPSPEPPLVPESAPPPGMSTTAKIALAVLGLAAVGGVVYAVTREPPRRAAPPPPPPRQRARSSMPSRGSSRRASPTFASPASPFGALPPPRGGR